MNRRFADISSNNPSFDGAKYASAGFVLLGNKVSGGGDNHDWKYVNPTWWQRAFDAHKHHVSVLYYHFADRGPHADDYRNGIEQAKFFIDELHSGKIFHAGCDAICLDIEQGSDVKNPVEFRKGFEHQCIAMGHKQLVVYSDAGFFSQYGKGLRPKSRKLWIAAYPTLPRGWWPRHPWAHQFTDAGKIAGIAGTCDVSFLKISAYLNHRVHRP